MSLKAKLPIWVFVLIAAIGLATSFLLVNYGVSILGEISLHSLENVYWTKKISPKDNLANWKIYRNEEYGFEVKYPSTWKFGKLEEAIWFAQNDLTNEPWVTVGRFGICPLGCVGFGLEFLEPITNEIVIDGLKAERIDYKTGSETTISTVKFLENKLPGSWSFNDQSFDLFFDSNETNNQFNQILSTFKFIEERVIENGYKPDYIYKTGASGIVESSQLVFVSPEGEKILIPDNIAILIDGPTQDITSFDLPLHPQNKDIIFLSTYEPLNKASSRIANRIYSYNLETSELKEIYYEAAENNSPIDDSKARILITVGIDGSKIIVLYDDPENWPGPCTRIWYHYKDQMGYLELADIQGGLKSYTVPVYKVEEGRTDAEKCLNEL